MDCNPSTTNNEQKKINNLHKKEIDFAFSKILGNYKQCVKMLTNYLLIEW